ncbi:MAG: mandelate racemase/muconate lactonizing enzyme family protein [Chloroflexi bacterium]|nr:mandelate racemase/muconate lactonizing enzyme family protein [Chloroflexota bacterium]MCC6894581.1 mandelate racemase/muconate lactonizing enzyme family protein [Anaerolineae bacterium]
MKITAVKPLVLGTPWRNLTFVKVETDEGIYGLGEVRLNNRTNALLGYLTEAVPRYAIGVDPFDIESLVARMTINDYGRMGEVTMSALSILEIACWDIVGKALGQPCYRLMGGAVRDKIKAYANGWYTVERTPEAFHAAALKVIERGYLALKIDPFGAGRYELSLDEQARSTALIEAVRDAVGPDREIMVEMHGRFNPATAIIMARKLAPFRPAWIEEPCPPENLPELKRVAERVEIPIATGERLHTMNEFRPIFDLQAVDIIQPDITHFGGITQTRRLAAWADVYNVLIAPHNVGGPVSTAAALHMAACTPNFMIQEHFNDFADSWVKAAAPGVPEVVDGYFALPDKPGLGVELNEALFADHPYVEGHFDLFKDEWHRREKN